MLGQHLQEHVYARVQIRALCKQTHTKQKLKIRLLTMGSECLYFVYAHAWVCIICTKCTHTHRVYDYHIAVSIETLAPFER